MYRRAVVPLDGSPVAEAIIPFLLEIAGPLDLEVVLVRVVQPQPPQVIEGSRHVVIEDCEARRIDAEEYLATLAVELRGKGIRAQTQVRRGEPSLDRGRRPRERRRSDRHDHPWQLLAGVFAFVALAAAVRMLLPLEGVRLRDAVPASRAAGLLPAAIGLVSALMGSGGGTLSVPALGLLGVPVHRAVGTSAWLGFWIALPAAIGYAVLGWGRPDLPPWSAGYVSLVSMALLLPVMWLAAPGGAWLAHRLSHRALRRAFGVFLLAVALRMAWWAWS